MSRRQRQRDRAFVRAPPGAPPGTLNVPPKESSARLDLMAYGPAGVVERHGTGSELEAFLKAAEGYPVRWLDVTGTDDPALLEAIGKHFGLHPLSLEDVAHAHQRAKVEAYEGHAFITMRSLERRPEEGLSTEQISLFVGAGWLVSFQERPGDEFDPVRERIRTGRGKTRSCGADYLAYSLLDAIVDSAFPVLETYDHTLDGIEARVVAGGDPHVVSELHRARADLLQMRRVIWPMREALAALLREDAPEFSPATRVYLRDCHDHAVQLLDLVESWREIAASLMDLHMSAVGQRTNETMRLLTVISVLFMPMTFIAGVYGMNFEAAAAPWSMPELRWRWGYPVSLGMMFASAAGLYWFFRRKGLLRPELTMVDTARNPSPHTHQEFSPTDGTMSESRGQQRP
jgi:magnesium transporter